MIKEIPVKPFQPYQTIICPGIRFSTKPLTSKQEIERLIEVIKWKYGIDKVEIGKDVRELIKGKENKPKRKTGK